MKKDDNTVESDKKKKAERENIHKGHRSRLRNRFNTEGLDNFDEHNVLELTLFYSLRRQDTNELAHRLINKFGSFSAVCDAPIKLLMDIDGVGIETATFLKLIPQLCNAYLTSKTKSVVSLESPDKAIDFFAPRFIGKTKECVMVAYLGASGELLNCETVSTGMDDKVLFDIKSVMVDACALHSKAVIIAHNHPSGICKPSKEDIMVTDSFAMVLGETNIKICDHLIFTPDDCCRMSLYETSRRSYYAFF